MEFYVLGVAPSRHSSGPSDAKRPWCEQSPSGQKVRCLTGHLMPNYENASSSWPGARRRGDRMPLRQCGYDLLRRLADEATADREVLVLGLQYWRPVFDWLRREHQMAFDGRAPIGRPLAMARTKSGAVTTLQVLPHPRNWPEVKDRHVGPIYRRELIGALERQRIGSGGTRNRPLLARDYDDALSRYGL